MQKKHYIIFCKTFSNAKTQTFKYYVRKVLLYLEIWKPTNQKNNTIPWSRWYKWWISNRFVTATYVYDTDKCRHKWIDETRCRHMKQNEFFHTKNKIFWNLLYQKHNNTFQAHKSNSICTKCWGFKANTNINYNLSKRYWCYKFSKTCICKTNTI